MLSAAIACQVLRQENPQTIDKVKAVLEQHPWYANQWQARLQDVPVADHVLFMQAARWADNIRMRGNNITGHCGTISIGPSSPMGNRGVCKSENPSR
jgi:hypothetical protein